MLEPNMLFFILKHTHKVLFVKTTTHYDTLKKTTPLKKRSGLTLQLNVTAVKLMVSRTVKTIFLKVN